MLFFQRKKHGKKHICFVVEKAKQKLSKIVNVSLRTKKIELKAVAYAGIINGRGFKTEIRYNDVILKPL